MKNYEKYADKIRELKSGIGVEWCDLFAKPKVLKPFGKTCEDVSCGLCNTLTTLWLLEDYEEPETDWSKVEVDTPILVRVNEKGKWIRRHFAKYENGLVYAWKDRRTSWTSLYDNEVTSWRYAKLAESEEKCEKPSKEETKKPETDWSKVKVDTPILVRDSEDSKWLERYFAKFEDNKVYAWLGENTSYTACGVAKWNYAKLAESEEE